MAQMDRDRRDGAGCVATFWMLAFLLPFSIALLGEA